MPLRLSYNCTMCVTYYFSLVFFSPFSFKFLGEFSFHGHAFLHVLNLLFYVYFIYSYMTMEVQCMCVMTRWCLSVHQYCFIAVFIFLG